MSHVNVEKGIPGIKVVATLSPRPEYSGDGPLSELRHCFRNSARTLPQRQRPKHPNPLGLVAQILPVRPGYELEDVIKYCQVINVAIGCPRFQVKENPLIVIDHAPLAGPEDAICIGLLTGKNFG